jgi:putative hydrolase of the HAD superfamily
MEPLRDIAALLLDLDQTLLDNAHFRTSVVRTCEAVAARNPSLRVDDLLTANASAVTGYFPEAERPWTLGQLSGVEVGREIWRRTLLALDVRDGALVDYAADLHLRYGREAYRPFDDVPRLFDAVEALRLPIALVTNGAADSQRDKLRALGIEQRFAAVVISGEVGRAKPDAVVFAIALERLGVPAERAWHVGDNVSTDVAGALAAGCNAVWLNRRNAPLQPSDPQPHLELRSLTELVDALRRSNIRAKR